MAWLGSVLRVSQAKLKVLAKANSPLEVLGEKVCFQPHFCGGRIQVPFSCRTEVLASWLSVGVAQL